MVGNQNLREVSVHLMREGGSGGAGGGGGAGAGGAGLESGVHAVSTRWAAAQLEAARALCRALTRALAASPQHNQQRGFTFMYAAHALLHAYWLITLRSLP